VLVLAQHLAVTQVLILIYRHSVGLSGDVQDYVRFLAILVHGSLIVGEGCLAILMVVVVIKELAEALHANPTEDTEDVALVFIEFWNDVNTATRSICC
jgi:ABC-type phosphate transport system permease subunit